MTRSRVVTVEERRAANAKLASVALCAAGGGLALLLGSAGWPKLGMLVWGLSTVVALWSVKSESVGTSAKETALKKYLEAHQSSPLAVEEVLAQLVKMAEYAEKVNEVGDLVLTGSRTGLESIGGIQAESQELLDDADALSRSSQDVNEEVSQIQIALNNVEHAISRLSTMSDRSTEFISEVGGAMGQIREHTDQSLELLERVESNSRHGQEAMKKVQDGVGQIRSSSESTMQRVADLSRQSKQIEQVLGIITDVADETGLLSLNAAILAAQAGENGEAFAVVADQIRSLARRTQESIKNIESIVREAQQTISEVQQRMAISMEAVSVGELLGTEASERLDKIETTVAESVTQARFIAETAQTQDERSSEMVYSADLLNTDLHEIVKYIAQSTSKIEHISSLVSTVTEISGSVRKATELNHKSSLDVSTQMQATATGVEDIKDSMRAQVGGVSKLEASMNSVADSASSNLENLEMINSIVKELELLGDTLKQSVNDKLPDREDDEQTALEEDVSFAAQWSDNNDA
jgi:methyl-accepting chemotaxis protein